MLPLFKQLTDVQRQLLLQMLYASGKGEKEIRPLIQEFLLLRA